MKSSSNAAASWQKPKDKKNKQKKQTKKNKQERNYNNSITRKPTYWQPLLSYKLLDT